MSAVYSCCGITFPESLGKYGCPNCEGAKVARLLHAVDTCKLIGGPLHGHTHLARSPGDTLQLEIPRRQDENGKPLFTTYRRVTITAGDKVICIWRHVTLTDDRAVLMAMGVAV